MTRTKIETPVRTIKDLTEANDILGQIAALKRDLTLVETGLNEAIDGLKAKAEIEAKPLKAEINELGTALEAFATYHKVELFKDKRSIELAHGIISWRKSTEIKPLSQHTFAMVLGYIKAFGLWEAIRTKEDVNRDELHTWSDEKLEMVGARRVEKDVFGYELKREDMDAAA